MAFRGSRLNIHGAFAKKKDAEKKERQLGKDSWIRRVEYRSGQVRYLVLSSRGKRGPFSDSDYMEKQERLALARMAKERKAKARRRARRRYSDEVPF